MLRRLVAFVLGTLRIEVHGGRLAQFLNLCLEQGIALWDIRRRTESMRATLSVPAFRGLRPVARTSRSRVRILRRQGLPFAAARVRRRPVLLAGALACAGFLLWMTGHLWTVQVRVTGPQYLDGRAVAAVAAEAGLKRGVWKRRVNLEEVRQHLARRLPEASWVVIRVQGTRAIVEVVEKAAERPLPRPPCVNLVARKAGVIEQVIPFQGEPAVRQGDVVRPGDLLIECSFKFWPGGRPQVYPGSPLPPREGVARTLVAQGIVRARIAYEEYREVALYREVPIPTGRKQSHVVLNWKGKPILRMGAKEPPFQQSQEVRRSYPPSLWRIWKPPVELVIVQSEEVQIRREPVSEAHILGKNRADLAARLRWILGAGDRLLTPLRVTVTERGTDYVGVRLYAEALEQIATPREGVPTPAPDPPPTRP